MALKHTLAQGVAVGLCHATMPPSIIDQKAGRRRQGRRAGALCASRRLHGVAGARLTNLLCPPEPARGNHTESPPTQWSGRIERGNRGDDDSRILGNSTSRRSSARLAGGGGAF